VHCLSRQAWLREGTDKTRAPERGWRGPEDGKGGVASALEYSSPFKPPGALFMLPL